MHGGPNRAKSRYPSGSRNWARYEESIKSEHLCEELLRARLLWIVQHVGRCAALHHGAVDRLCLAHGSAEAGVSGAGSRTVTVRAVPGGFVLDDVDAGSVSPIVQMLGPAEPARTAGVSLPTARLSAALNEGAGDGARTTRLLAEAGVPAAEAAALGPALGRCSTFAEIVGFRYGDGTCMDHYAGHARTSYRDRLCRARIAVSFGNRDLLRADRARMGAVAPLA